MGTLFALMRDEEVAKILTGQELLSFQRWRAKGSKGEGGKGAGASSGGGQGGTARGPGGGKGGAGGQSARPQWGQRPPPPGIVPMGARPGTEPFAGKCNFCLGDGHRKADCVAFDKYMSERRAQGLSGPRGQKGGGKGGKGFDGQHGGKGAFGLDYGFLD